MGKVAEVGEGREGSSLELGEILDGEESRRIWRYPLVKLQPSRTMETELAS